MKKISRIVFLLILLLMIVICQDAFGSLAILHVRHWTAPDHTRVVLDVSGEASYTVARKEHKIYVDVKGAVLPGGIPHTYNIDKPAVKTVLLTSLPKGGVRVELQVADNVGVKAFKLKRILKKPYRIVIDIMLPEVKKKESDKRKQVKVLEKKIVVIDPGHGGEDPGAVGRRGTLEKNVVLGISKRLQRILRKRGYEAFLTRRGDYFISLKNRGKIAREYGADIFISIHADACRSRGAHGTSVYYLSTRGASSEAAKLLAKSENLSDIVGGSQNGHNNGESDPITLNMLQTETINRSRAFGVIALKKMGQINHLKSSKVQRAPFKVLKLPDITSVLIETAFISNSREELMLRSSSYQTDIAWAIAYAVDKFIPLPYAADRSWVKKVSSPKVSSPSVPATRVTYKVKKGDILERIAVRHGTTMKTLMKINNLKSKNRIYVGQKLKLFSEPKKVVPSVYVVKRGDILERIARRHGTTLKALMKINNLKSKNRIYVGQKLKLFSEPKKVVPVVYVVKREDNLESIAVKHGTTIRALMKVNRIRSRNKIYVGQKLKIPGTDSVPMVPVVYVVKRGDNLESIAIKHGTTIRALMKVNRIRSRNRIYVGQKLKIPYA
ncbi:MAG: LysM peptidoglycan-binding domain-containing protein [Syntrophobacterales bacterium]|nr:LysM peptidoglycan-binding domain-containing protein [Syntrophobacterales bacterium]